MKNYPLIKLIINILSNNSTRFFESYIKDFKLNLNNFSNVVFFLKRRFPRRLNGLR